MVAKKNSMECDTSEERDQSLLPSDVATVIWIPNSIQWVIKQFPNCIKKGDHFWFYYEGSEQHPTSSLLYLGTLSTIHHFFGRYAMIKVSPIRHFRQDQGWVMEDRELFWVDTCNLCLNSKNTWQAQSGFLQNPTFTPLHSGYD